MQKLKNLRDYLLVNIPMLNQNPERLSIFADKGKIVSNSLSLSFEYDYTVNLIVTDFAGDPDTVMVTVLAWYKHYQQDKAFPSNIEFEADILNHQSVDLSLKLPLSERVIVTIDADGNITDMHHCAEPVMDTEIINWPANLIINGEVPTP
ncbi:MAG: phage tail protein [Agitococcus sp.]|nr:phage tail protein [Agitococcus sp.]